MESSFDLLVIGSGPAGQHAAIQAAALGKRVAVIDHQSMLGGETIRGGTIPSKTLREAILFLSGFHHRQYYGRDFDQEANCRYVHERVQQVVERGTQAVRTKLHRCGVTLFDGTTRFVDPNRLAVKTKSDTFVLRGEKLLVACGSQPQRAPDVPYDGRTVIDSGELHLLEKLPREFIIVGAGLIGVEYASMFAALGVEVTLIEEQATILDWLDQEIVGELMQHMRDRAVVIHQREKVVEIDNRGGERVTALLASGKHVRGDVLLHAVGRVGNTDRLRLSAAGLSTDARGFLSVDEHNRTRVSHIYAAGDVIGFPGLASASMIQGRRAATHMFGAEAPAVSLLPHAVWTVPEIAMVGRTPQELERDGVPYACGIARYESLPKGQILGEPIGMLKLLFEPTNHRLLGVHALGESAAELIHIGQVVLTFGEGIEYFSESIFNHPTFAEAYRVAALDGLESLRHAGRPRPGPAQ